MRPGAVYPGTCLGYWDQAGTTRTTLLCPTLTNVKTSHAKLETDGSYTASVFLYGLPDGTYFLNLTFAQNVSYGDTVVQVIQNELKAFALSMYIFSCF